MLEKYKEKRKLKLLNQIKNNTINSYSLDYSNDEIKELLKFKELNPIILEFICKFNYYFKEYNGLLLSNIEKLDIYVNHGEGEQIRGEFDHNNLYLFVNKGLNYNEDPVLEDTIFHELLHASTYDENNIDNSGLSKRISGHTIGHRLNEGYTEYLTNKYFSNDPTDKYYYEEQRYAENIERIIGKEVMLEAYFTGNLYKVIESLNPYIDDSFEFILDSERFLIKPNEVLDKIDNKKKILIKR